MFSECLIHIVYKSARVLVVIFLFFFVYEREGVIIA